MIIKVPGKKPGVCNSFVELIDMYPTVAELAGLQASEHLQGKSLVKTIDNPEEKVRDMAFSVSQGGRTLLLRTDKWAYIQYNEDASAGIELFDMINDPKQYTNLANYPAYANVVADFKEKMNAKLKEIRTNDLGIDYSKNATENRKH
jgi:arylsulfatase A-like enzyme